MRGVILDNLDEGDKSLYYANCLRCEQYNTSSNVVYYARSPRKINGLDCWEVYILEDLYIYEACQRCIRKIPMKLRKEFIFKRDYKISGYKVKDV